MQHSVPTSGQSQTLDSVDRYKADVRVLKGQAINKRLSQPRVKAAPPFAETNSGKQIEMRHHF